MMGAVQVQALIVAMKEIYGWLLIIAIVALAAVILHPGRVRPFAIFPKWSTIRRKLRHGVRLFTLRRQQAAAH